MFKTLLLHRNVLFIKCKGMFIYSAVANPQDCSKRFISLADQFNQTPSQRFWEASSHMLQLMREDCSYPTLSIARCSFIQLSELEKCRVKKLAQGFSTAAQDSNVGSLSRESEVLILSQCALYVLCIYVSLFLLDEFISNLIIYLTLFILFYLIYLIHSYFISV